MNPDIASIHERMAKGGDWRAWQLEIASLHEQATTEAEYVMLLEAHQRLVAVGEYAYDAETYERLLPIAHAEYLMFLNREAMEGTDMVNPMLLDRITAREVAAGRMDPDDDFRQFAQASGAVLGDTADLHHHHCRHGTWFFAGMAGAGIALWASDKAALSFSPLWLIGLGLATGWIINQRELSAIKQRIADNRAGRAATG